jgi:DNA-binding response OmpR family regulator
MIGQYIERDEYQRTVLIVEDDEDVSALLVAILEEEGHCRTLHAYTAYQALEMVKYYHLDLLLLDYHLPDINGLDLYDCLSKIDELQGLPMLLVSANPPLYELRKRNLPHLKKPFDLDELLVTVDALISQHAEAPLCQ